MTIKKISLSLIATMAMSGSVYAYNGTLSSNGTVGLFSTELISHQDVDHNISDPLVYTCGIENATASEAGFELKLTDPAEFSGANNNGNLGIYRLDTNESVAVFDRYDATAHSIIFSAVDGAKISRGLQYVIGDSNETIADNELEMNIVKGSKSVVGELIVTDNTGTDVLDKATSTIMTSKQQFSMQVTRKFDARINAADSFETFYDRGVNSIADDAEVVVTNIKDDLTIAATASDMKLNIVADQNLTQYKITSDVQHNGYMNNIAALTDYNQTISANNADQNASDMLTVEYETDKTNPLAVTHFTATGVVTFGDEANDDAYTATLLNSESAGAWTIYGYNAQIPNVASTSNVDVVIKFTNRSSIDSDAFFTLIDQDGTVVSLDSTNGDIAALPSGTTSTYRASDLISLVSNPDFDKENSFSVEVAIPTTPDLVYGFASFKNLELGQFKDLPIYNTSGMTY